MSTAASAPTPTRREQRKAETRARLLEAARRLFAERGFDATRPQDVARAADVATGTFYVHFADKREAFLAVTEAAAGELMARIRERVAEGADFEARLSGALEALLAYAEAQPGLLAACFADAAVISAGLPRGASLRDRLAHSLAEGLARGQTRGEIHPDYDPQTAAAGVVGFVQHALVYGGTAAGGRAADAAGGDRAALIDQVTRFCARALVRDARDRRSP